MQIIRYKSSSGIAIGMSHNGQLIGYFQPNSELHDLLRLRTDELRMQIENSRPTIYRGVQPGAANNLPSLILAPIDGETEVWAAGVTYKRSEQARMEESGTPDIYAKVYTAKRPELFFELVTYLFLENDFPDGVFLCTGTALVPERQFTLEPGDVVQIDIDQLGTLRNPVVRGKVKLGQGISSGEEAV